MTITNPARGGDLVDFLDSGDFRLTVNGDVVDFSDGRYKMEDLDISYEGKTLRFTDLQPTSIGSPVYANNQWVQLQMDFGSGLETYFKGKIRRISPTGENNRETITYTAYGMQQLANEVIVTAGGIPSISLSPFSGSVTVGTISISAYSIGGAIAKLFELAASALAYEGIPATIGSPGVGQFGGWLKSETTIENSRFVDAVKRVVSEEPDKQLFFDDTTQTWIFPSIFDADVEEIAVGTNNLPNLSYDKDCSDRFTAVTLWTKIPGALAVGPSGVAMCSPLWNAAYQADWSLQKAYQAVTAGGDLSEYAWVYRRWQIPEGVPEQANGLLPVKLWVPFRYWNAVNWIPFYARVDWDNGIAYADHPVVIAGNAMHKGRAIGAQEAYLIYYEMSTLEYEQWVSMRTPSSGYEGTAYTELGIERDYVETVDLSSFNRYNAQSRLNAFKDILINGSVDVEGDPIPELLNLQKRIAFTHPSKPTGIGTEGALFTGYKYEFGKRGKSTLMLTTDQAKYTRVS